MTEELDPDEVIKKWEKWIKKLKEEGMGATAIAKQMNIHRDSVYRLLKKG